MAEGGEERGERIEKDGGEVGGERMALDEEAPCESDQEERGEESARDVDAEESGKDHVVRFGESQHTGSSVGNSSFGPMTGAPVTFGASACGGSSGGGAKGASPEAVEGEAGSDDQAEWEALALACPLDFSMSNAAADDSEQKDPAPSSTDRAPCPLDHPMSFHAGHREPSPRLRDAGEGEPLVRVEDGGELREMEDGRDGGELGDGGDGSCEEGCDASWEANRSWEELKERDASGESGERGPLARGGEGRDGGELLGGVATPATVQSLNPTP